MSELYYKDYTWIKKRPVQTGKEGNHAGIAYKILSDSYQKKIVIERYLDGKFDRTIYDSSILDFKSIKQKEGKELWYKEKLNNSSSLIRDECGRVVVLEKYQYEDKRLISTTVHSPHGLVLARQDFIHLEENQVLMKFFDSEGKLVFEEILRANN